MERLLMGQDQVEFRPFGVESRARPCRVAFLVDPAACPPELLDALFEANYGLWGGRFNPIIPVRGGEISDSFWSLLRTSDPDLIYTYCQLTQATIDRVERELVPWQIEAHPAHLGASAQPIFQPSAVQGLVSSRQVLPFLMSHQEALGPPIPPSLLTYYYDWKSALNKQLSRLVGRNFGLIHEVSVPKVPDEWPRLQIQNDWTPQGTFHGIAHTPNLLFPFQASVAQARQPLTDATRDEYCIVVGDSAETWIYFWNRIFLVRDHLRSRWSSLCLSPTLLGDEGFVTTLREFLKRYAHASGGSPGTILLHSFECSEEDLAQLRSRILDGLHIIPRTSRLSPEEFPPVSITRQNTYVGWGSATTYQQGTSRESLLNVPRSSVPIDRGAWAMDMRVQYVPPVAFYDNEVLSWKLPRRYGIAEAFFNQRRCRVDAEYSLSVEMRGAEPFVLRIPTENEIFHRAAGVMEVQVYDSNLKIVRRKPKFKRLGKWDKGLYLNGILELFGGLQSTSHFFEHSFWRGVFQRLSLGSPKKETGLFERVKNTLEKKRPLIVSQLAAGHPRPIDWLSHLVIGLARDLKAREEEISFEELKSSFHEQRERFISATPSFRGATSPAEIEHDRNDVSARLLGVLQWLTDRGVLQQGVRVQCANCGSRFWREIGRLKQTVQCDGCGASVAMPVESKWSYRLNSLIRNGIALHGCVPVTSALRCLRELARDSFIYTHGVALFREYDDLKPESEIDLLCISNGKLVCGEVKSSASEFTRDDLAKLAGIAADIGADQVAISAFNDPENLMVNHSKVLLGLLPTQCSVTICRPHQWAFAPDPHP